jgi:transposase InsO family protein
VFASRERQASGNHEFDQLCQALNIEHRLTKPRTPRTNGMVERFNGRIADVLKTHRFTSGEDLAGSSRAISPTVAKMPLQRSPISARVGFMRLSVSSPLWRCLL